MIQGLTGALGSALLGACAHFVSVFRPHSCYSSYKSHLPVCIYVTDCYRLNIDLSSHRCSEESYINDYMPKLHTHIIKLPIAVSRTRDEWVLNVASRCMSIKLHVVRFLLHQAGCARGDP